MADSVADAVTPDAASTPAGSPTTTDAGNPGKGGEKLPLDDTAAVYEGEHNLKAKAAERRSLEDDVEAFLRDGGEITEVPRNLRADLPKRPESNYGRGSI